VLGDLEDVKREIAAALRGAPFLTVLAAVDAEKPGTIVTPGPAAIFEGEIASGRLSASGYPVAEVIGLKTTYDPESQQSKLATHELSILWTQAGDDELTITTHLERLVRATRDFFWPATGPVIVQALASAPIAIVSEEYTALLPSRDHPFVKGSSTLLQVQTQTL
jgi:hypothetical protein